MQYDVQTVFSDGQAIVTSAPSTNKYGAGAVVDLGRGSPQRLVVRVDETVTAAGAATVEVQLQTASDEAFTSPVTLMTSGPIPKVDLVQGRDVFVTLIPPNARQFLRVYYNVANGPLTAGKFTAALVAGLHTYKPYPAAAIRRA